MHRYNRQHSLPTLPPLTTRFAPSPPAPPPPPLSYPHTYPHPTIPCASRACTMHLSTQPTHIHHLTLKPTHYYSLGNILCPVHEAELRRAVEGMYMAWRDEYSWVGFTPVSEEAWRGFVEEVRGRRRMRREMETRGTVEGGTGREGDEGGSTRGEGGSLGGREGGGRGAGATGSLEEWGGKGKGKEKEKERKRRWFGRMWK
ncbi:hypothetical protein CC80DRAFT_583290 [Byssothecium circinans]|uniref:Uncharacterized protein n=1 Tax=Byssothecium circinans TaxID=147558 RepID=A0A6A5T840_9PLEO|nr:hypothetical protein CC80DRAFT_583290 [Byssothecium circinans]